MYLFSILVLRIKTMNTKYIFIIDSKKNLNMLLKVILGEAHILFKSQTLVWMNVKFFGQ